MKIIDRIAIWIGLFLLFFVTSIVPVLVIASFLDLDIQGINIRLDRIAQLSLVITVISFLIFSLFKKLSLKFSFFNFPLFNFLSAVILGVSVFAVFGWFYFPHFNGNGYFACNKLIAGLDRQAEERGRSQFTLGNKKEKYNLGKVDDFIKENGNPTSVSGDAETKEYVYWKDNTNFCLLYVEPNTGVIENVSVVII